MMVATAENCGVLVLELRNNYSQLEHPLRKAYDHLLKRVEEIDAHQGNLKEFADALLPEIFNIRIKTIEWAIRKGDFNVKENLKQAYSRFITLKENPELEVLAENILFALRCNRRITEVFMRQASISDDQIKKQAPGLPGLTYDQFLISIAYAIPDVNIVGKLIDLTRCTLTVEFVSFVAVLINEDLLNGSSEVINELSALVSEAGQEQFALAEELGFFGPRMIITHSSNLETLSEEFIKEQKFLSELGLSEYASNIN